MIPSYRDRVELIQSFKGIGVEVGCATGWYSNRILLNPAVSLLISIDPFSQSDANECNLSPPSYLQEARITLDQYGNRSQILKLYSAEASYLFKDEYFDFVFIDADHEQISVLKDMDYWWPKVKPEGILAGHDYSGIHPGVKAAVDQFVFEEKGIKLCTTELDQIWEGVTISSWYFQKPGYHYAQAEEDCNSPTGSSCIPTSPKQAFVKVG